MFLQVHFLTSYHATLLNRDNAGFAKRIRFGGVERLRVSSQCQKRHWRENLVTRVHLPTGIRSRHFFSRQIKKRAIEEKGIDPDLAHRLIFELAKGLLTSAGDKNAVDKETLYMKQPVLFGKPEADYLLEMIAGAAAEGNEKDAVRALKQRIKDIKKEKKQNFQAMMRQAGYGDPVAGVEGALFGRFVTSDILTRVDAPVHVAHAFTTHALETEVDFFTVVDDLSGEEETGAAHANDMELGAGVFYGYVAVDVPLLVSNLTGADPSHWRNEDPSTTKDVLSLLIRIICEVSPGAKLGATAPYAKAECVVLEAGSSQPRSLANAFLKPVRLDETRNPVEQSAQAMADYLTALEQMYGKGDETRYVATIHSWPRKDEPVLSLTEAVERVLSDLFGEEKP